MGLDILPDELKILVFEQPYPDENKDAPLQLQVRPCSRRLVLSSLLRPCDPDPICRLQWEEADYLSFGDSEAI